MRVDRRAHRLEVVAHDEERAARGDRVEQVADAAAVGRAGDRRVLRRHEVERRALERVERVGVGVMALDPQTATLGLGGDAVQRPLRDVARGHVPALLGQPDRIAALAGADVERAAGGEAADLVDERAVGVAAPHLVAAVAVIPVGLVGRWSGGGLDVVVGEAEADHRADPAAVGRSLQHLLARVGHVAGGVEARYRRRPGRVRLDEVPEPGRVRRRSEAERRERFGAHPEPWADRDRVGVDAVAVGQLDRRDVPVVAGDDAADALVDDVDPGGSQGRRPRGRRRRRRRGARR